MASTVSASSQVPGDATVACSRALPWQRRWRPPRSWSHLDAPCCTATTCVWQPYSRPRQRPATSRHPALLAASPKCTSHASLAISGHGEAELLTAMAGRTSRSTRSPSCAPPLELMDIRTTNLLHHIEWHVLPPNVLDGQLLAGQASAMAAWELRRAASRIGIGSLPPIFSDL